MPYSSGSTLANVLRVGAAFSGMVYGSWKLSSLKAAKSAKEAVAAKNKH